jgi:hypothetical protein
VEPAYDLPVGHRPGDVCQQLVLIPKASVSSADVDEDLLDLAGRVLRSQKAPLLGVSAVRPPWPLQKLVPDEECCPECAAGVPRRGLDPDILEGALTQ